MSQDVLTLALRETVENASTGLPPPSTLFAPSAPAVFNVERLMADLYRAQPAIPQQLPQTLFPPWYRAMGTEAMEWLRQNSRALAGETAAGIAAVGTALTAPVSMPVIVITLTVAGSAIAIGGYYYANQKNSPDWFGQSFANWAVPIHNTVWLPSAEPLTRIQLPGTMSGSMSATNDDPKILPFRRKGRNGPPQNQVHIEIDPANPTQAYIKFWKAPLRKGQLEPGARIVIDEENQWNGFDMDLDRCLENEGWSGPEEERETAYERLTRRINGSVGTVVEREGSLLRIRFQRGHTDRARWPVSTVVDRVGEGEIAGVEIHFDPDLDLRDSLKRIP